MKEFWVDYSASMIIKADTKEEAEEIFYQVYSDDTRQFSEVNYVVERVVNNTEREEN